jgi:tight adherence protein B
MLDVINPLNVLLAALFAAGLFAIVAALLYQRPVELKNIEKLYGGGVEDLTLMQRLQRELDAARFHITAGEFLRVSVVLAVLAGLGTYLVTGGLLVAALCFVLGGMSYWLYLSSKATKAIEEYEDQLPQVAARLVVGARLGNTLQGAAAHVAKFGPSICREDWAYIAAQLDAGADLEQVLRVISQKRGSQLLNSIFELLLVQHQRKSPLVEVMPVIQESLAERIKTVRQARTKMNGPIRELWIVCAAPFAGVILLRFLSPQFAAIYSTLPGQLILLVGWAVDLVTFAIAYRAFSNALRRETNFYGALKGEPRTPLRPLPAGQRPTPTRPGPTRETGPIDLSRGRGTPSALAGFTAQTAHDEDMGRPS